MDGPIFSNSHCFLNQYNAIAIIYCKTTMYEHNALKKLSVFVTRPVRIYGRFDEFVLKPLKFFISKKYNMHPSLFV